MRGRARVPLSLGAKRGEERQAVEKRAHLTSLALLPPPPLPSCCVLSGACKRSWTTTAKDVETTFGAVFQLSYEAYGAVRTVDLVPGGGQVAVTAANRREYVRLYVQHTLVTSVAPQYEAFARGFTKVPSPTHRASLSLFRSLPFSLCRPSAS